MHRRAFLTGALASPLVLGTRAQAQAPIFIADMHFHSFFAESKYHSRPLAPALAAGNATLVAWSLVADLLWFDAKTYKQKSEPKPGEALGWFQRELGRIKAHIAEQKLKIVRHAAGCRPGAARPAAHRAGGRRFELHREGCRPRQGRLRFGAAAPAARALHAQHARRHPDRAAEHPGLTELGKQVVRECNRLGVLIDLAHCTEAAARDALSISRAPLVWSHGSVTRGPQAPASAAVWRRRQLSLDTAKAIASKGGVVGLWSLNVDVGKTVEAYADRMIELAEWLGEDHVAFGTDINGLGPFSVLSGYGDVRRVVEHWQRQGVADARIRKLAIGNYARVLKAALQPARG